MTEERRSRDGGEAVREGVRSIVGILGALKDAIEESIGEVMERAEGAPERAREAARSTMKQAKETVEDVKERFDFVAHREVVDLREEVARLAARVRALEEAAGLATPPPAEPAAAPGTEKASEPLEERPFRIDSE
jgi:BMFP domain-containing protein YqiC